LPDGRPAIGFLPRLTRAKRTSRAADCADPQAGRICCRGNDLRLWTAGRLQGRCTRNGRGL